MFERSLIASQVQHASAEQRWTAIASVTLQMAIAATVITLPLMHPERLAIKTDLPKAFVPVMKLPQLKPVTMVRSASGATVAVSMPAAATILRVPGSIPRTIDTGDVPAVQTFTGMGTPNGLPQELASVGSGTGRAVTVTPVAVRPNRPARVSSGVAVGMLLQPIRPVYPAIAKAAHVEGTVVVEAVISKLGTIESLHVTSGPPMLRSAALEAVRLARYQPFQLNGEVTEVQTTITVNFRIGG